MMIDSGNTAWVIVATALVLLMTIPGLAFFYGGLVKRKNLLSILMQCFVSLVVVSLLWAAVGYSLTFAPGHGVLKGFIGGFDWAFLNGVGLDPSPYPFDATTARIPHVLFMMFQMMFAVITPALIVGAFAERMKFSAFLWFTVLWSLFVYAPIAHWLWASDGWLFKMGAVDFAGGIVVHVNAGIAALVAALVVGRRTNLKATHPHNLAFTALGTGLLWFGWFGFNAGSALAANGLAANALMTTHLAGCAAAVTWLILDWIVLKRPTVLGVATGAVAGLAAVTPASGYVTASGAIVIGIGVSLIAYFFVVVIKPLLGYDDALDAFGVHGVGGIWGSIMVGVFASPMVNPLVKGALFGNVKQLEIQLFAVAVTLLYSLIVTLVIFLVLDKVLGVRVSGKEEAMGLDISHHNERAYTLIE